MRLASLRLVGLPPFSDVTIPFSDEEGAPRALTVLVGGGGVGKTTILAALAQTRPGYAVALGTGDSPPFVVADWALGADDKDRPHCLRVATPNAKVFADESAELVRRREQAHFERVAKDGGFAVLVLPSSRWFSRQAIAFAAPARTIARYDIRAPIVLEDASRTDLARETKQALAYAAITAALSRDAGIGAYLRFGQAMTRTVDALTALIGFSYAGIDPASFEPMFKAEDGGHPIPFDALPTRAKHLVAIGALTVRLLWSAYPLRDPVESEAVVCVDEIELQQDPYVQGAVLGTLRESLPRVQWIVTTSSAVVAASVDAREVFALRRLPRTAEVQLFAGQEARLH